MEPMKERNETELIDDRFQRDLQGQELFKLGVLEGLTRSGKLGDAGEKALAAAKLFNRTERMMRGGAVLLAVFATLSTAAVVQAFVSPTKAYSSVHATLPGSLREMRYAPNQDMRDAAATEVLQHLLIGVEGLEQERDKGSNAASHALDHLRKRLLDVPPATNLVQSRPPEVR